MDEAAIRAALRSGDEAGFAALVERHRRQLLVHCYRMVGSLEEAEDLVQETFLRAWRGRADFEGRSLVRTWLYRIATNVCLNALERTPRRGLVADVPPKDPHALLTVEQRPDLGASPADLPWLQPFPDRLLEPAAPADSEPDAIVVRPHLLWREGRDAIATRFARYIGPDSPEYPGQVRLVPTVANRQPATVTYLRRPDDSEHRLAGLNVLDVEGGLVVGIVSFGVELLGAAAPHLPGRQRTAPT
jgi:RNA polymerase sigma factor (sigma-70 family)